MLVLGINAYHGDVAAAILRDGELVAAVEEERFRRVKHYAGFPRDAIRACLTMAGAQASEVDAIAVSRNPRAHLWRKPPLALPNRRSLAQVRERATNWASVQRISMACAESMDLAEPHVAARMH